MSVQPEVWLRGPVSGIPALLQPVAHALLQAQEEIHTLMTGFTEAYLWEKPEGLASVGFHLQHITGVLNRLFTYAAGLPLSPQQLEYLAAEGKQDKDITVTTLLAAFDDQLDEVIEQLKKTDPDQLTAPVGVGRKQLPSTVMGLLFHAAEHTMRHNGQLLVTARIVSAGKV